MHSPQHVPSSKPEPTEADERPAVREVFGDALWTGCDDGLARLARELSPSELGSFAREQGGPLPAGTAEQVLEAAIAQLGRREVPEIGMGERAALQLVNDVLARYGLDLTHPASIAHLQPPSLALATAADTLASVVNASVDTFDSGPSAVAIERWVITALAEMAGFGSKADGVMTPGGSVSNLLGLLLARDSAAARQGVDARRAGVASIPDAVVLCSELAHFSVHRACSALGLGEDAVVTVPCDDARRMDAGALQQTMRVIERRSTPVAIVATAGTTDFGSVDPLPELSAIARRHGVWLHVDAAYGFGALFSNRLASRVQGLALADSVTLDLHKLGWQPAAASVLLVAEPRSFAAVERHVDYLNPRDDAEAGYVGLLGRSLQTTRRADAVKVAATLLGFGRARLGRMVDACHDLARHAQARIEADDELELVAGAELTTVVFRLRPPSLEDRPWTPADLDGLHAEVRRRLLESGDAVLGRTTVNDTHGEARVCLKLTLLNPRTRPSDLDQLLDRVLDTARACVASRSEPRR
ncbi:MAG: pyridoxal-dependent decarboxylase [Myxococcota bacterium]